MGTPVDKGVKEGLIGAEQRVIDKFKQVLQQKTITNTGELSNSFRAESTDEGMVISFKFYGQVIDNGRRRGSFPPLQPIKEWMRDKGIRPKEGQTQDQTAFAIAKRIEERGIAPRPFLQPTLDDVVNNILVGELEEEIAKEIESQAQIELNKLPKNVNITI